MPFLTAEWRDLAMLNWEVPPELLAPLVPRGTETDTWQGRAFVSLVAFRFLKTRVLKLPVPWHMNFEEVNLRFYVRRRQCEEVRRGVVFVKEFVPRVCIALVARRWYNENYYAVPMSHQIDRQPGQLAVRYAWTTRPTTHAVAVRSSGPFRSIAENSQEEFITEHYWGYCRQRDGTTMEYQVEHPRWHVARVDDFSLDWNPVELYGPEFGRVLLAPPASVFLADGSPVAVRMGRKLPPPT
jgi:hypothetical protein